MKLYSTKEAARFLGLSHRTLEKWRVEGTGPCYRVIGKKLVKYEHGELERFGGRFKSTSQYIRQENRSRP